MSDLNYAYAVARIRVLEKYLLSDSDIEQMIAMPTDDAVLAFLKESLLSEIETIKTTFPYTLKTFLNDREAVREKQEELRETLARWQEQEKVLQERLDQLKAAG